MKESQPSRPAIAADFPGLSDMRFGFMLASAGISGIEIAGATNTPSHGAPDKGGVVVVERPAAGTGKKTQRPPLYKVLLLNDDYTTMDFVVYVLERHFGMERERANIVMRDVHEKGVGLAGVYTREVAETKVAEVIADAQRAGHPLQLTCERE